VGGGPKSGRISFSSKLGGKRHGSPITLGIVAGTGAIEILPQRNLAQ